MMRKKSGTVKQAQKLDKTAIESYGVPSLALMENAGRSVAQEVLRALKGKRNPRVCIFCGLGNNAGDGFVAARHLINKGVRVKIFLIGKKSQLKGDTGVYCNILRKVKYPIQEIRRADQKVIKEIQSSAVIVDAIFGVGLNRVIRDPFKDIMEAINKHGRYIVSVDVPSGLNATTGEIYGTSILADKTVTFVLCKKGFFIRQGPRCAGRIVVADIGIPLQLIQRI